MNQQDAKNAAKKLKLGISNLIEAMSSVDKIVDSVKDTMSEEDLAKFEDLQKHHKDAAIEVDKIKKRFENYGDIY